MIPAEAVEAAAKVLYEAEGYFKSFDDIPTARKEHFSKAAAAILEAAAPHMLAEAWDDGESAGQDNADSNRGFDYRAQAQPL